jgi:multicomponent Na+:H+ antiporter subunit B
MSPQARRLFFLLAVLNLVPAAIAVARNMPAFGRHPLPYGDAINAAAPLERHVTNMVSAINFDYRGFDTLGEEFMLLCAATGATMLLRAKRGEDPASPPGRVGRRPLLPPSDGLLLISRLFGPLILLFGLYIAVHAMTTPGGGFQGGVIVASGLVLVFLGESYRRWRATIHFEWMDFCEGAGATLYALCGFASMAAGAAFLQNILPFGQLRDVFSGGLMLIENAGVACAVGGGFTVIFIEFLEETREEHPEDEW